MQRFIIKNKKTPIQFSLKFFFFFKLTKELAVENTIFQIKINKKLYIQVPVQYVFSIGKKGRERDKKK